MITRSLLIDDLELRLTGGKPSDDLELERAQLGHWIDIARDKIASEVIRAGLDEDGAVDADFIFREQCLPLSVNEHDCNTDCGLEYFFDLKYSPISLPNDRGVVRMTTNGKEVVNMIDQFTLDNIKFLRYSKPNKDNLIAYREGMRVYVDGLTRSFLRLNEDGVSSGKIIVSYVPESGGIEDEDDFQMPGDIVADVIEMAEAIGRRQLGIPQDVINDGTDLNINSQ